MKRTIIAALAILYAGSAVAWGKADKKVILHQASIQVECAFVENATDTITQLDIFADACPPDPAGKPYRWIPVVGEQPAYDPVTQVLEGPTVTVQPTQVLREWTVRAKTAPEADAELQARIDNLPWPIKDTLCDLADRVSQLEGAGSLTEAGCNAYLKGFAQ